MVVGGMVLGIFFSMLTAPWSQCLRQSYPHCFNNLYDNVTIVCTRTSMMAGQRMDIIDMIMTKCTCLKNIS